MHLKESKHVTFFRRCDMIYGLTLDFKYRAIRWLKWL